MAKKGEFQRDRRRRSPTRRRRRSRPSAAQPGVTYVEGGAQPIEFFQETSNTATRGAEAASTLTGADGTPLTGKGVSVAVIDSGVDPTHPYFKEADGSSRRRRQPQGAVRAADRDLLGPEAARLRRHRHALASAATAPTSTASSPVARPR